MCSIIFTISDGSRYFNFESIIRQHGDYWWILIVVTPLAGIVGGILSGMIIVWEWKKEGRIESFSGEIQKLLPAYGKVTGEPLRMPRGNHSTINYRKKVPVDTDELE